MHSLSFDSNFLNNSVFILDGLKSSDYQTATHLNDELLDLALEGETPYCTKLVTRSRADLFSALVEIRELCREGVKPIIHIEAHGSPEVGIVLGDNEEPVTWHELGECFTEINKITKNNLGVVMAACYGLYAITPVEITKPAPFYFLIGSDHLVEGGVIDESMKKFYRVLFNSNSLTAAMKQVEDRFKQFHVERLVYVAVGKFIKQSATGKGRAERVEHYVSIRVEQGRVFNRETMRKARREAKAKAKNDSKSAFERAVRVFLHGRQTVTYEQLYEFATQRRR